MWVLAALGNEIWNFNRQNILAQIEYFAKHIFEKLGSELVLVKVSYAVFYLNYQWLSGQP